MTETHKVDFTDVRWGSVEWMNLCTLYLRAYESRSPAPILGDTAAAEAVDRIEYDWARMHRAMRPGSISIWSPCAPSCSTTGAPTSCAAIRTPSCCTWGAAWIPGRSGCTHRTPCSGSTSINQM